MQICAKKAAKDPTLELSESDAIFKTWKHNVLYYEEIVLSDVYFDLGVSLPHGFLCDFLEEGAAETARHAIGYANDVMDTCLYVRYEPRLLAALCVYSASCLTGPVQSDWFARHSLDRNLLDGILIYFIPALRLELVCAHDERWTRKFAQERVLAITNQTPVSIPK